MPVRTCALIVAAAASLGLAGCGRGADSGATANPNAPGRPGTGTPTQVVTPAAGDSAPGGPSGVAGSAPHPGSSGGDAVPGATGSGTVGQAPPAGSGLQGGMGSGPASSPAGTGTSATTAPGGSVPEGSATGQTGQR
ncbi:hypothetical protein [Devosia sp.]|uniref:hypothetical protein n=1 Tax=Devosia sp. TaxID=1871048 RepID=UPI002F092A06